MQVETCPRCYHLAFEVAPADPDVGIMVALLDCRQCGECFIDENGEWHFLSDEGRGRIGSEKA